MSRAIASVACGFAVAACSFLSSSPPTDDLRFESEPPAAEVKTSTGQTCRTPCELRIQLLPELSATFSLDGHEPQTVSLKRVPSQPIGAPRFSPNPVYVELQPAAVTPPKPAAVTPPTKMLTKKKPAVAARTNNAPSHQMTPECRLRRPCLSRPCAAPSSFQELCAALRRVGRLGDRCPDAV